jgi:hypothetical protein
LVHQRATRAEKRRLEEESLNKELDTLKKNAELNRKNLRLVAEENERMKCVVLIKYLSLIIFY